MSRRRRRLRAPKSSSVEWINIGAMGLVLVLLLLAKGPIGQGVSAAFTGMTDAPESADPAAALESEGPTETAATRRPQDSSPTVTIAMLTSSDVRTIDASRARVHGAIAQGLARVLSER